METGKSNQASNLHWGDQLEFAMNLRARYLPLGILVTADWERLQLQKNTHITGENFECFTRTTCWAFLSRFEKVDKEKTCTQDWKLENKIQDFTCCSQVPIQKKTIHFHTVLRRTTTYPKDPDPSVGFWLLRLLLVKAFSWSRASVSLNANIPCRVQSNLLQTGVYKA